MRARSKAKLLVDEAVVLRVIPVGEGDAIVSLLARDHGKVRLSVKRIRSIRSGFAGRFELLTRLRLSFDLGRELGMVREAHVMDASFAVASDPALAPFCAYLAELCDEMLPEHDPSERAYRLLHKAVAALHGGAGPRQVARYVEYWMLRLSGHVPDERTCALCGASLVAGRRADPDRIVGIGRDGMVCARCATSSPGTLERLDARILDAIAAVRRRDLASFGAAPLPEPELRLLALFSGTLLRELLGKELRTAAYLRRYHLDFL